MKLGDHTVMLKIAALLRDANWYKEEMEENTEEERLSKVIDAISKLDMGALTINNGVHLTLEETTAIVDNMDYLKIRCFDGLIAWGRLIIHKHSLEAQQEGLLNE